MFPKMLLDCRTMTFMLPGIDRRYDIQQMYHIINVHRIMPQTLSYDVNILTFIHAVFNASSMHMKEAS